MNDAVPEPDPGRLAWMYRQMLRIREFEERVKATFTEHPGVIRGHTHLADGAEASIVGSLATLRTSPGPGDQVMATYRCHGYPLVLGSDPNAMMAEIYGRATGLCGGYGGSMHLADPERGFLATAIRDDNPVCFFHHYLLTLEEGEVPEGEYLVPFGQADVRRAGDDVTIVATGAMVGRALAAADALAASGVEAEVIDPRTLVPLDMATILDSVRKTGRLVLVDQATRHASAAAVIAAEVADQGFASLKAPVKLVTALDATIPYSKPMEQYVLPDEEKIVSAVRAVTS